jgi:MFS family permease
MFYFFYILNALGFVCGGPLPNQVLLSECFEKSRGKAMGFAYLRIGIGGAMVPWISNFLVQHLGWQAALRSVGLLILALAFPAAYFVKEPPASRISELTRSRSTRPPVSILKVFMTLPFYLLVIGSMCSVAAISGVQQNLKLFLVLDHQYAQSLAARFLSLVLTFSIVGRLTMGWLADRFHPKYVMVLIYSLVGIAIPIAILSQWRSSLYVFSAVFGIGPGGDYMIISLVTTEIFSMEILGRLLGVILTAQGVAESVSPWVMGHIRDACCTYFAGFLALDALAFLAVLAACALPKQTNVA